MANTVTYTSGTHTLSLPTGVTTMQYLCVAAGGSGGYSNDYSQTGSGGAGGYLEGTIYFPTAGQYKCIVAGSTPANYVNQRYTAANSSISGVSLNIISKGGGMGAGIYTGGGGGTYPSTSGGSGGGGGQRSTAGSVGKSGEGYGGGNYAGDVSGGGGGAGGAGKNGNDGTCGGCAGIGRVSTISGTSITFAIGGSGGSTPRVNRGDGGSNGWNGGNTGGASGIIIIKYSTLPIITTRAISGITETTAISGGIFSGGTSTKKGICWNTTGAPTTGNSHTNNGSGIANFTATMTGLSQNHTYYVRAYGYNASEGIIYGNEISFNLPITAPSLTGGTKTNTFPLIGWSGKTQVCTWTGATVQRWYQKISGGTYSIIASPLKATGNTYSNLTLAPNINYLIYSTFYGGTTESPASNIITIRNNVSAPTATYSSILMI